MSRVYIRDHIPYRDQVYISGDDHWSVARLVELSRDFEVFELSLLGLNLSDELTLDMRGLVTHFRAMMESDLSYPIILDENGLIMDGRHRVLKALYEGREFVKAVRFSENPVPCNGGCSGD